MKRIITTLLSCAALFATTLVFTLAPERAFANDESAGVQRRVGDASPSASSSNIDNYVNQDEQLNLGPDDNDVLVLRANEKVLLNRYVTKTFPIHNAAPRELREVMRELTGKEGGRAEVIRDTKKKQNFLQVICPKWQLPFIEQAVPMLDTEWLREDDDGTVSEQYAAQYRDIEEIDRIASRYAGEGYTTVDTSKNTAMRVDEPYREEEWLKACKIADVPEHKAQFTVTAYETSAGNDLQLGLDYVAWKNGPGRNFFDVGAAGYDLHTKFKNANSYLSPLEHRRADVRDGNHYVNHEARATFYSLNFAATAAYLDFLASKGKAKVYAEGSLVVKSGQTGTLRATDQVVTFDAFNLQDVDRAIAAGLPPDALKGNPGPYGNTPERIDEVHAIRDAYGNVVAYTTDAGDLAIHNRQLERTVNGEVGLAIDVSPTILKKTMEVGVVASLSAVSGYTPQGLPIIEAKTVDTKVRMKSGVTTVLAGLTRDEKIQRKAGIPLLHRIPVLGWVFGGENNASRRREIVIAILPEFEEGGGSAFANLPKVRTLENLVTGESAPELPKNNFGFDQWLLGEGSGSDL